MLSTTTAATSVIKYTPTTLATRPQGDFYDSSNNLLQISSMASGSITLSGTVSSIGCYAFHNINNVTTVTLPESVTKVGYFAFSNCKSLTSPIYNSKVFARLPITQSGAYNVPSGITTIASAAFRECNKVTSVTLPSTVTEIEESAFSLCSSLTEITLSNAISKIGSHAFWQCSKLAKIHAGAKPAAVSSHTFDGITASSVTVYVPSASVSTYKNTAIWKNFNIVAETQAETSYTIHFSEGGYNDVSLKYSEKYVLPTPTKSGYTFNGWTYNGTTYKGGTEISALTSVNGATLTLSASWTANESSYTIHFSEGGYNDVTLKYTESYILPSPTKSGYTFNGWTYNGTTYKGGETVSRLTQSNGAMVTLTASWTIIETPVNGDFRVWFHPFQTGTNAPCYMRCETNVQEISFDLVLPQWIIKSSTSYSFTAASLYTISQVKSSDNTSIHITIKGKDNEPFGKGEKIQFATLKIAIKGEEDVYTASFKNITVIASNNTVFTPEEYSGNYFNGSPTAWSYVGDYSSAASFSLLQQAINRAITANYGSINLQKVTSLPAKTKISTNGNPNSIIYANKDLDLINDINVVIDNHCNNLVVSDDYPFKNSIEFTATKASYERHSNSEWGTLFLPFEISSNQDVKLYQIAEFDANSEVITLSTEDMIPANTPCLFTCTGTCSLNGSNVRIPVSSDMGNLQLNNGTFYGTFDQKEISDAVFYMMNNTLWRNMGTLTIKPYRGWFDCVSSAKAIDVRSNNSTSISITNKDADIEGNLYDLTGNKISKPLRNTIYILNGKKVLLK